MHECGIDTERKLSFPGMRLTATASVVAGHRKKLSYK